MIESKWPQLRFPRGSLLRPTIGVSVRLSTRRFNSHSHLPCLLPKPPCPGPALGPSLHCPAVSGFVRDDSPYPYPRVLGIAHHSPEPSPVHYPQPSLTSERKPLENCTATDGRNLRPLSTSLRLHLLPNRRYKLLQNIGFTCATGDGILVTWTTAQISTGLELLLRSRRFPAIPIVRCDGTRHCLLVLESFRQALLYCVGRVKAPVLGLTPL